MQDVPTESAQAPERAPSERIGLVGFGGSHIGAMITACKESPAQWSARFDISFVPFREPAYQPLLQRRDGKHEVNEKLSAEIQRQIRQKRPSYLFCSLLGGGYIVDSLINHPQPFYVLPPSGAGKQNLQMNPEARLIPYDAIVNKLGRQTAGAYALLAAVMEATGLPVYQICPPPPIGDEAHIRQYPGTLSPELIAQLGIAPKELRCTLWLAYVDVLRAKCRAVGAFFVEPPEEVFAPDGCLSSRFYSRDAVHANWKYGDLVLQQLADIAEKYQAWRAIA